MSSFIRQETAVRFHVALVNQYGDRRVIEVGDGGAPISLAEAEAFAVTWANEHNDPPADAWGAWPVGIRPGEWRLA